ncbi:uncharacterized protein LOC115542374 isoform X1 [Gadus morhua]|uniref:uncharacterized protein LOC115542374 isoform X1 n=2 Tax=Gadus morhua TaxID=8049 RepID=UPI0011B4C709|nr:uncharacterized protein LOC115542374 isoform X1 [Gadus morhua]
MKNVLVPTLHRSATNLEKASSSSAYIQQLISRDVACQTDHLETHTFLQPHFKSEEDCDAFGDRSIQRGATSEILVVVAPGSSHWSSRCEELVQTPDTISIKLEEDIGGGMPAVEDCDAFVDRGTQCGATSEILGVVAPGSSHWSSRCEELVQQTPDTISIKLEEDIGGGLPAVEDCDAFVDRGTQCGATSEILGVIAPGSSHWSSRCEELVQTPDTISIKLEEDIGGGLPAVEDCDAFVDRGTQCGATSEILGVIAPGSSHWSSRCEELVQQTPGTISIKLEEDIGGGMTTVG